MLTPRITSACSVCIGLLSSCLEPSSSSQLYCWKSSAAFHSTTDAKMIAQLPDSLVNSQVRLCARVYGWCTLCRAGTSVACVAPSRERGYQLRCVHANLDEQSRSQPGARRQSRAQTPWTSAANVPHCYCGALRRRCRLHYHVPARARR